MKIKLNTSWGEETGMGSILMGMIQFALSCASISVFCVGVYLAGVDSEAVAPVEEVPPGPEIATQSQTLKIGDEIVVVNTQDGLRKYKDHSRKKRYKELVKNGDTGKVTGIVLHDEGYLMHQIEWCNEDKNWVSQNDPNKNEVYLKKR